MSEYNTKLEAVKSHAQYWLRKVELVVNKDGAVCPNSVLLSKEVPAVLGRAVEGVNVRLLSRKTPLMISRKHATVEFAEESWMITDHGSVNGVFVNGAKISPNSQHPLSAGDKIVFGCPATGNSNSEFEYVFQEIVKDKNCKRQRSDGVEHENSKKRCFKPIPDRPSVSEHQTKENITNNFSSFDQQINMQEERIKILTSQLNEKEQAHVQLAQTLEKKEQDLIEKLEKQRTELLKEKEEEERKLEQMLEQQLKDKESNLKNQFDEKIKNLIAEKNEVEKNLQEELTKAVTEKDQIYQDKLKEQGMELERIIREMEAEKRNREEEAMRNRELLDNLKNREEKEKQLGHCLEELKRQILEKDSRLMQQQDVVKSAEETGKRSVLHQMEDEFTCMICHELFVDAVTLSCAHSFCEMCLRSWIRRKNDCPVCRKKINGKAVKSLVLDNAINKMIENADSETRQSRLSLLSERNALKQAEQGLEKNRTTVRNKEERGFAVLLVTDAERQQEEARLRRIQNRPNPVTFHPASREPPVQANIDTDSRRNNNSDRNINRRAGERPHSWRSQRETGQGRRGNHNALLFPNPGINHNLNQHGLVDRPANWNEGVQYERRRHNNNHGGNRVCFRCGQSGHLARNCNYNVNVR